MFYILVIGALIAYVLWAKVLKMYYSYWFYTRQGIACIGFPWPFIGNMLQEREARKNRTIYSDAMSVEYLVSVFGKDKIPNLVIDYSLTQGVLYIVDPDIVQELYGSLNKYTDKSERTKTRFYLLTGESILFDHSTLEQANRRKHLAVAFYKDRMSVLLS